MPIYNKWILADEAEMIVWSITEEEHFFINTLGFTAHHQHEIRRKEHLAGRFLLQYIQKDFPLHQITISDLGKPVLPEDISLHFSISHSYPYVTALVAKQNIVGVDIQVYKDKIVRLQHKFLSESEQRLSNNNIKLITLCWCVKEAVYKWYGKAGIDFINHIHILQIEKNADASFSVSVSLMKEEKPILLNLNGMLEQSFALAWVIQ